MLITGRIEIAKDHLEPGQLVMVPATVVEQAPDSTLVLVQVGRHTSPESTKVHVFREHCYTATTDQE